MKFFTDLIQSIQLRLYSSSKEFKKRNLPIDMADVLTRASKVLVCLPEEADSAKVAAGIVDKMSVHFPAWKITLLTRQQHVDSFLQNSKYTTITYADEDVAKSGKPKKNVVEKFLRNTFDVAIDMSIPFSFTNLVFVWLSKAQLRIGFHHDKRESLYNFLIRHKADATLEYSHLSLVNYLQSFH